MAEIASIWDQKTPAEIISDVEDLLTKSWNQAPFPDAFHVVPSSAMAERLERERARKAQDIFLHPWEVQVRVTMLHRWMPLGCKSTLEEAVTLYKKVAKGGCGALVRIRAR